MIRSFRGILSSNFNSIKKLLRMILFKFLIISRAIIRMILPIFIFFFFWHFYSYAIELKKQMKKDSQTQQQIKNTIMKFRQHDIQENYYKIDFFKSISTYQKIKNFYDKEINQKDTFYILYGPYGIGKSRGNIHFLNEMKDENVPSLYINTKEQFFRQNITQNQFVKSIIQWKSNPQNYFSKLFSRIYNQNFGNQPLLIVIDQISTYGSQIHQQDRYEVIMQNILQLKHSGLKIVLITQYQSFINNFNQFLKRNHHQKRFSLTKLGFNQKSDFKKFAKKIKFDNKARLKYVQQSTLSKTINFLRVVNCFSKHDKKQINLCLNRLQFKHTLTMINNSDTKLLSKLCKNPYAKLSKKQKKQSQYLQDINFFFDDYFGTFNIFKAYSQYMKTHKNIKCKMHKRFLS